MFDRYYSFSIEAFQAVHGKCTGCPSPCERKTSCSIKETLNEVLRVRGFAIIGTCGDKAPVSSCKRCPVLLDCARNPFHSERIARINYKWQAMARRLPSRTSLAQ